MPGRTVPLVTNQIYHILNRGNAAQPIFLGKKDYERILDTLSYYQNIHNPVRFSFFLRLPSDKKEKILKDLRSKREFSVDIISFCLMTNHFHLLLKQVHDNGISSFMSNVSNSYTRYFNTKNKRFGHLFQGKFKAVRIETNEQLLHVSRYIHLNPYASYVLKSINDLEKYSYSSLPEYLNLAQNELCNKELIISQFKNTNDYKKFIINQADSQRELNKIKHLTLESGSSHL